MAESLEGAVIAQFESRRASDLESLIQRHGGHAWSAPALSEVSMDVGPDERGAIDDLAAGAFDVVVLLTGVATRRLLDEASVAGCLAETRRALERATVVARGPKPVFALRQHDLKPTQLAPEPNTTKDLLETLGGIPVAGRRVLILSAGESFAEPLTSLQARGAHAVELQLYRWTLTPSDEARLGETIRALADGRIDAAAFTTQVQVRHLFDVAARTGESEQLAAALRDAVVVGAVGPTCATALRDRGIEPDVVPDHPKMGHLVVALANELARRRGAVMERSWKEVLAPSIPPDVAEAIDLFENQMELRKQGKLEEKVFAELRLRRGAYGQRYDNGKRYDGAKTQEIPFPRRGLTKGPETEFDAPGMQRIKIPFGKVTAEQLEVLADVAEEYSNAVLHITTRQDVQLHFVDIEDTPDMHRRLASVGITTREACGNSVRNVTGCPYAGICHHEAFDISPYAQAEALYLLGHRDVQDFGRKFKIAYSGCATNSLGCGRAMMHDLGFVAGVRDVDGREERGFKVVVGGGLGPVPHVAKTLYEFLPVAQMIPVSQAIARVYARLGEKRNRNKARIKFLVAQLGIDEFKRLVDAELATLEPDPRWTAWLDDANAPAEYLPAPVTNGAATRAPGFDDWVRTNVYTPRQPGFVAVLINLPLGDMTSRQARALADVVRAYTADALRTTVDQNLLLRWIHERDLVSVYNDLHAAQLSLNGATTIADVTTCPGTDTCKLGIASSRGLGAELRERLHGRALQFDPAVKDVHIRVSGCPNSCGLHHIGDIGFYGSSRNVGTYKVPHFQVILGGSLEDNAANYGLAIGAVPSKRAPETVDRLLGFYAAERVNAESFRAWVMRVGKKTIKERLQDLMVVPSHEEDPSFYVDWHDAREYSIGDIGVGECAGEVVSLTQFSLATAESKVFDASLIVDDINRSAAEVAGAAAMAYAAMVTAAQGLIKTRNPDITPDADVVFDTFKTQFIDTQLFLDRFIGASQWQYFQAAHESRGAVRDGDEARRRVEEAQLFIEAVHACYARLLTPA